MSQSPEWLSFGAQKRNVQTERSPLWDINKTRTNPVKEVPV